MFFEAVMYSLQRQRSPQFGAVLPIAGPKKSADRKSSWNESVQCFNNGHVAAMVESTT